MLTLGISFSRGHDSAVALLEDGELIFAAAEERFSRRKHDGRFPSRALQAGLTHAGVALRDVDGAAFGWNRPGVTQRHTLTGVATGRLAFGAYRVAYSFYDLALMLYAAGGKRNLSATSGRFRQAVSATSITTRPTRGARTPCRGSTTRPCW